MCDMQKMPTREDASCEEDDEMNFAAFSAVSGGGTHYVTGGQVPVTKLPQNNGTPLSQVVGMVGVEGGVQYVRAMEGSMQTPQIISVPVALPGSKPGDPPQTVQIQVLSPNMLQPQPKYHMQIPIQGFQQGAVLTVQYSPDDDDGTGLQLMRQNARTEYSNTPGLQVLAAMPQDVQLVQQADENVHQVFITPDQQIIINAPADKTMNNNTTTNNNNNNNDMDSEDTVVIKEEFDEGTMDNDESMEESGLNCLRWSTSNTNQGLVEYLSSLTPQASQALPRALQQFLRLNAPSAAAPAVVKAESAVKLEETVAEAVIDEDGTVQMQSKKKKKYKKKPPKPARPKPGAIVITSSSDGTPLFCCPECQMAYPEKEQLEMHLSVHKIERRFICGICGAGLKRKEHLERHKLGHNPERPFVCAVCGKGFKRREHLNLHTVMHSGVKSETCNICGKGFYRKDHLRKHTRSHENRRARDEGNTEGALFDIKHAPTSTAEGTALGNTILPEITIHVPTSANVQVPVQINIPQHVVTSLAAAQAQQQAQQQQQQQAQQQQLQQDTQAQLEALLAQHT